MTFDLRHQAFQVVLDIHCKKLSSNQKEHNNKNQNCFVRRHMNYVQSFCGSNNLSILLMSHELSDHTTDLILLLYGLIYMRILMI